MVEKKESVISSTEIIILLSGIIIGYAIEISISEEKWFKPIVQMIDFITSHILLTFFLLGVVIVFIRRIITYRKRQKEMLKEEIKNLELIKSDEIIEAINQSNKAISEIRTNLSYLIELKWNLRYDSKFLHKMDAVLKNLKKENEHS